jgi:hypothetical protein
MDKRQVNSRLWEKTLAREQVLHDHLEHPTNGPFSLTKQISKHDIEKKMSGKMRGVLIVSSHKKLTQKYLK